MKLTNMEALNATGALAKLMEMDLPIKASLDIALISNLVDVQTKNYGLVLQNLYKKYSIKAEPQESGGVQFACTLEEEVLNKETKEKHDVTWRELGKLENGNELRAQMIAEIPEVARIVKLQQENLEAFAEKLNDLLEANTADMNFKKIQLPDDITIKPEILKALTEFVEIG